MYSFVLRVAPDGSRVDFLLLWVADGFWRFSQRTLTRFGGGEHDYEDKFLQGTKTYWTEHGNGAEPAPGWDTVSGTAVVSVDLAAGQYKVTHGTTADTYAIGGGAVGQGSGTGSSASYAWSKRSGTYHYSTCDWVKRISADNLVTGTTPPDGKTLHQDCQLATKIRYRIQRVSRASARKSVDGRGMGVSRPEDADRTSRD